MYIYNKIRIISLTIVLYIQLDVYVINMSHQPPSSPSMPIYQHRHLSKRRSRLAKELTEVKQAEREEQKTSGKLHNEEESWVRDRGGGKDA